MDHSKFMALAIDEGKKSEPIESAYCVGCVIASLDTQEVISVGYSRELPGNTHAEECALMKFPSPLPSGTTALVLYTTMEPCSTRLSGKKSCTERIIEFNNSSSVKIKTVVGGVREPDHFVQCKGTDLLSTNGVEVVYVGNEELEKQCAALNKHLVQVSESKSK
jgi:pyrimidine deaminase RibD-like protein